MIVVDLDFVQIHHSGAPAVPVCPAAIWARLWVTALRRQVAFYHLLLVERFQVGNRAYRFEVHRLHPGQVTSPSRDIFQPARFGAAWGSPLVQSKVSIGGMNSP